MSRMPSPSDARTCAALERALTREDVRAVLEGLERPLTEIHLRRPSAMLLEELLVNPARPEVVCPEELSIRNGLFLTAEMGPALARSPVLCSLRRLELDTTGMICRDVVALLWSPNLANLETLIVHTPDDYGFGDEDLTELAVSPSLGRVQTLELTYNGDGVTGPRALGATRTLESLTSLRLEGEISKAGVRALLSGPALANLKKLALPWSQLDATGVQELVDAVPEGFLANLEELDLSRSIIGDGGVAVLAGQDFPALKSLSLRYCALSTAAIRHLFLEREGAFPALETLDLSANRLGGGLQHLAYSAAARAGQLRSLDLSECGLDALDIRQLFAEGTNWSALRHLNLGRNSLEDEGVEFLRSRARAFPALESLVLTKCKITDDGARAIAGAPWASTFASLTVGMNNIGPAGCAALAGAPGLVSLTALNLEGNLVGDEGAAAIAASETLSSLRVLTLRDNEITSRGAESLAASKNAEELTELNIDTNSGLGDAGARALAASPYLGKKLEKLSLSDCELTVDGVRALGDASFPALDRLYLRGTRFSAEDMNVFIEGPLFEKLRTLSVGYYSPVSDVDGGKAMLTGHMGNRVQFI